MKGTRSKRCFFISGNLLECFKEIRGLSKSESYTEEERLSMIADIADDVISNVEQ